MKIILKYIFLLVVFIFNHFNILAQEVKAEKTKLTIGLSAPELFHAGISHRITNSNLLGISVGAGPSLGTIWPSINLEHRIYFGKNNQQAIQKTWFFRQGTTYFPSANSSQQFTLTLTAGKDIVFKNGKSGITIDAGTFYLPNSDESSIILIRSLNLWPALRFELYFSL